MALVVGAALIGSVGLPAVGSVGAAAAGSTLYVNNAAGANCTDVGSGAPGAPFCTVGAAAAVVQPGQTVEIAEGTYAEDLTVTRSGTEAAPVTFRSAPVGGSGGGVARFGGWNSPSKGITVRGAEHVRFENLTIAGTFRQDMVLVDASNDVGFTNVSAGGGGPIHVTNGSRGVTYARGQVGGQGPVFKVDGGATGTVLTTNGIMGNYADEMTGIAVNDAPGTVIVSNTVYSSCFPGIVITGGSGGAVVENNVVDSAQSYEKACPDPAKGTGITVAAAATAGTKVDYNLVDSRSGGSAYDWAGTKYGTQAAFTAATGQGAHDFVAPSYVRKGPGVPADHRIDSADENAPGMLPVEIGGFAPADDPTVPNTGTGKGYRDRGAYEDLDVGSAFTPAGPTRLLDTREAVGVPGTTAVPAGGTVDLQVAGVAGIPAEGVTAVTMNVTVTETQQSGVLTVYPHGDEAPNASNLNWTPGLTIPNLVTVPVKDGKVSFRNSSGGTAHVVADLAGYYSAKGYLFRAQGPTRLLDTREPIGVPQKQAVPAGGTIDLPVAGLAGHDNPFVKAVTMNVTVTEPTQAGFLTVYPHGDRAPNASNLNWTAGRTISNLVTVPVKDGFVSFHNSSGGTVHVIADLAGFYLPLPQGTVSYHPVGPWRIADTREDVNYESGARPAGTVGAGETLDIPIDAPNATAVTLNVTVTEPGSNGFLTAYPYGQAVPNASNLNFERGETIANQVVVPVKDGRISIRNSSGAPAHIVVDLFGYQGY
ncbi:right-handed parallel beta-helix repeat-containing protein [Kitasatospora sp. NPDC047058]|uniref:right-handed parallel beta-helix repeat-containing protein n=1 Tax=Kitasatospora sp. NPDC047058 TaxID=3155620 RepID=UPI00340478CE